MPEINDMPDLDAAMARLEAAEAEQTPPMQEHQVQEAEPKTQQPESTSDDAGKESPESLQSDTPAAAEKSDATKDNTEPKQETKVDAKPADDKRTPFQKNNERLDKTWKAVNEEKAKQTAASQQLEQRKADLDRREQEIAAKAAKAERKFTPEQYEQAAKAKQDGVEQLELQADGLDRRADQLENDGKFDQAEAMRKQANGLRDQSKADKVIAERMNGYADHLRKNPDPTAEQAQAEKQRQTQFFTVEAAKLFPELAKSGSPFQQQVTASLQEAAKAGLDVNEHPVLIYHAAQLVANKAAAARVPDLEKTIGELQAKVKEYEKLTTPGGGSEANLNPTSTATSGDGEDEATLRSVALAMS